MDIAKIKILMGRGVKTFGYTEMEAASKLYSTLCEQLDEVQAKLKEMEKPANDVKRSAGKKSA